MATKIIVSKRFRQHTHKLYRYLCKKHSAKVGFQFLERLQEKIEFISEHPETGKPSRKKENVRSTLLIPHNRIYYRYLNNTIEILGLFDMRKQPLKNKY